MDLRRLLPQGQGGRKREMEGAGERDVTPATLAPMSDDHDPYVDPGGAATRECHCRLCEPSDDRDGWGEDDRKLVEDVRRHGWSVVGIRAEFAQPGWAFTVGLWHTFGCTEVAMFGLNVRDMQDWLNLVGDEVRAGRPPRRRERREGIIDGVPVVWAPVDSSWHELLFGWMIWFYRRPPLPVVQLVWPDRHGRFPWEDGSGAACRRDQPRASIPHAEHPLGLWRTGKSGMAWPFPVPPDARVVVSKRTVDAAAPVRAVAHHSDGGWSFVDGGPAAEKDLAVAHLWHVIRQQPELVALGDLPPGWRAWQAEPDQGWERGPARADDA